MRALKKGIRAASGNTLARSPTGPTEPLAAFESAAPKTDFRLYAACVGRGDNNVDVVFYPIFNQEGLFSEARRLTATKRYLPPEERQSSFDIADAPRQVILQEPVSER